MKQKLMLALAGAAIAAGLSLSPAHAFSPIASGSVETESLVQNVHFNHHYCAWGPLGYHRHTWSGYRVACWRPWRPRHCWIDYWGRRHCRWY